jgi:hypothetical protein
MKIVAMNHALSNMTKSEHQHWYKKAGNDMNHCCSMLTDYTNNHCPDNMSFCSNEVDLSAMRENRPRRTFSSMLSMCYRTSKSLSVREATASASKCKSSLCRFIFVGQKRQHVHPKQKQPSKAFEEKVRESINTSNTTSCKESVRTSTYSQETCKAAALSEKEMYDLHMQAYLQDTLEEYGFYYSDELDFLYEDPEELEVFECPDSTERAEHADEMTVPIFELCVPICRHENSLVFDDCSEITNYYY